MPSSGKTPLAALIQHCCDNSSPQYSAAWHEFYDRYDRLIYQTIKRACDGWSVSRLRLQLRQAVEDICGEVYLVLLGKLSSFKNRQNEQAFRAWLRIICLNSASSYIQKNFKSLYVEDDMVELQDYVGSLQPDYKNEYYESIVKVCRQADERKTLERDLNIFLLRVFGDLSEKMVRYHPCCRNCGARVIQLAVFRVRDILQDNANLLR